MILESAQLLSTAHRILDEDDAILTYIKWLIRIILVQFGLDLLRNTIYGYMNCLEIYLLNLVIDMVKYICHGKTRIYSRLFTKKY